ncbi:MAG: 50S ribosomal protein L20 [Candidatus Roizmanbacteria bacterium]|uniref:Large ribosomal subunit protein bL20 n=2 Tax=Candidatus Roizmaniibacteriota TaxID=1752723 RepID=A0A2M8F367_9BACT|nr:50S ribosomal protein L20 [Candidatus Roizmanbacteria bacterium]PIZ64806.1 MAG: 50S ribosomal protein L20 [Candidatus Roizmanbacteria bacterium CG_4_10_14_0_2_um_filter_39_12]PJC33753.1 MAG: 50S ribosomal protein L20 [Candidatus Roizmanbacteria bacterium CG_4_9_14_0_2_um_filter_39_13]PJE61826.1 MAG: 50S ribosomal protein L20 [Candidatus Roizmanbacteria bacterium CG10_big_fil_rev_8_21_14_0_10_39_12]
MVRVKGGPAGRNKHKKVLKLAKGYWMSRSTQFKKAQEAVLHAGEYAFAGRKHRKRDMRSLWITRISAALKENGMKYSIFVHKLRERKFEIDRKVLAHLALDFPKVFDTLAQEIKK